MQPLVSVLSVFSRVYPGPGTYDSGPVACDDVAGLVVRVNGTVLSAPGVATAALWAMGGDGVAYPITPPQPVIVGQISFSAGMTDFSALGMVVAAGGGAGPTYLGHTVSPIASRCFVRIVVAAAPATVTLSFAAEGIPA